MEKWSQPEGTPLQTKQRKLILSFLFFSIQVELCIFELCLKFCTVTFYSVYGVL